MKDKIDLYLDEKEFLGDLDSGAFTAKAEKAGMSVQEFAHHVMANKDKYDGKTRKQANFALTAPKWKHKGRKKTNEARKYGEIELAVELAGIREKIIRNEKNLVKRQELLDKIDLYLEEGKAPKKIKGRCPNCDTDFSISPRTTQCPSCNQDIRKAKTKKTNEAWKHDATTLTQELASLREKLRNEKDPEKRQKLQQRINDVYNKSVATKKNEAKTLLRRNKRI
jgi:DNA repair exonuclease SbcCD ATPase subunit